jgi:hypothetical protein
MASLCPVKRPVSLYRLVEGEEMALNENMIESDRVVRWVAMVIYIQFYSTIIKGSSYPHVVLFYRCFIAVVICTSLYFHCRRYRHYHPIVIVIIVINYNSL